MIVRKAVIPVAGFGTRMLPASRSVPKVMFPVLDTPVVHHAVREAPDAGIDHVVFVLSREQDAISTYSSRNTDLENALVTALLENGPWCIVAEVEEKGRAPRPDVQLEANLLRFQSTFE